MDRREIIARLEANAGVLRALGIERLTLFGSVARAEARPDSDIDLMVRFGPDGGDVPFGHVDHARERLTEFLGRRVDIIRDPVKDDRLRAELNRDMLPVFPDAPSRLPAPRKSMPTYRPLLRLRDIVRHLDEVLSFAEGLSRREFLADRRTHYAVERLLLIVAEAAAKLGPQAETLVPGQPWQQIRGLGNVLRRECSGIDRERIYDTLTGHGPALRDACAAAVARLKLDDGNDSEAPGSPLAGPTAPHTISG